jgi:hypothetical protein
MRSRIKSGNDDQAGLVRDQAFDQRIEFWKPQKVPQLKQGRTP